MLKIPAVAVIMSTYNGEKFLAEQIDSILAQKDVHVELFVRDDGSTDDTKIILTEYAAHHNNIHINFGNNLGCGKSFLTELDNSPEFDFYAFSDQDDNWLDKKLVSAVTAISEQEAIHGKNTPILYFTNLYITDKNLNIGRKTKLEQRDFSLESSILKYNGVCGCTMVFNAKLRTLMQSMPVSELPALHDLIASFITYAADGIMICDSEAYIFYRQHGGNISGGAVSLLARAVKEGKRFLFSNGLTIRIAQYILDNWKYDLSPEVKKTFKIVANHKKSFLCRLQIIFSPKFRTGFILRTLYGKTKALLGTL